MKYAFTNNVVTFGDVAVGGCYVHVGETEVYLKIEPVDRFGCVQLRTGALMFTSTDSPLQRVDFTYDSIKDKIPKECFHDFPLGQVWCHSLDGTIFMKVEECTTSSRRNCLDLGTGQFMNCVNTANYRNCYRLEVDLAVEPTR